VQVGLRLLIIKLKERTSESPVAFVQTSFKWTKWAHATIRVSCSLACRLQKPVQEKEDYQHDFDGHGVAEQNRNSLAMMFTG
jgi:hypothetical protein